MTSSRGRVSIVLATAVAGVALAAALRPERLAGASATGSRTFAVEADADARAALGAGAAEAVWRHRLRDHGLSVRAAPGGWTVEIIGAGALDDAALVHALTAPARFEIRQVIAGTRTAQAWHRLAEDGQLGPARVHHDQWSVHDDFSDPTYDHYLTAPTRDELDVALAELERRAPRPAEEADLEVVTEHVRPDPSAEGGDRSSYVRTYLVTSEVHIGNRDVASAVVTYDENTLRPEVVVRFAPDAAAHWAELTTAATGQKLAIMLDGAVVSAPIIMGPIRGGATTVTMGGSDPAAQEAEAHDLARALTAPALPDGLVARLTGTHAGSTALVWALRLALGAIAGGLAWLLAGVADRRRAFVRTPELVAGASARWSALVVPSLVTFGLPALLWLGARHVPLPGLSPGLLDQLGHGDRTDIPPDLGVFGLGILPVISGLAVVELVAVLAPAWRRARLGTPGDRRGLDTAALLLALAIALSQGWLIAGFMQSIAGLDGVEGTVGQALTMTVSLAAGVMVHVVAATVISRHGLGNGWLALIGATALAHLVALIDVHVPVGGDDPRAGLIAVAVIAALATVLATRGRSADDGRRLPWAGLVPAAVVPAILAAQGIGALAWPELAADLDRLRPPSPWLDLLIAIPFTGMIAWATRRDAAPAGALVSTGFVVALVLLPLLVPAPARALAPGLAAAMLAIVAVELAIGARARACLDAPVAVLVVHDVERADAAGDALREHGIPHALCGVRARALFRAFGTFAPVTVLVPRAQLDAAATAITPADT